MLVTHEIGFAREVADRVNALGADCGVREIAFTELRKAGIDWRGSVLRRNQHRLSRNILRVGGPPHMRCERTTLGGAATGCPRRRAFLVAEDGYYAAQDLRRELNRLGATVIAPAPTLERALQLIEEAEKIDAAIGHQSWRRDFFPAADALRTGACRFLFTTDYDRPFTRALPRRRDAVRVLIPTGSQLKQPMPKAAS